MSKYKNLTVLLILTLVACGGGKSKVPLTETSKTPSNVSQQDDKVLPSVDDKSNSTMSKASWSYAALAGITAGTLLVAWAPSKIEAIAKFFRELDPNEASKINAKLYELANSKRNYEEITKKLPLALEDALKGNLSAAETSDIKNLLTTLLEKRAKQLTEITSLELQISPLATAEEARTHSSTALKVKQSANSLSAYIETLTAGNDQAVVDGAANKARLEELRRNLSLRNTDLAQTDAEIAKIIKANNRTMLVYDSFRKAKLRFTQATQSLDVKFHRALRSLFSKLAKYHATRIRYTYKDGPLKRHTFSNAKIPYITMGGFIIAASGITLYLTIDEGAEQGKMLAAKVIEIIKDDEGLPTKEELAELSNAE